MPTRKSPTTAEKKPTTRKAPARKTTKATAAIDSVAIDSVIAKGVPTHEEVASLAVQFWNERGRPFGSPEIDWFRAEATLHAA
jgi:hypothetical protein